MPKVVASNTLTRHLLKKKLEPEKYLPWCDEVDKYFDPLIIVSKKSSPCRQNDLVTWLMLSKSRH
jgi:hypothetical protein